MAVYLGIDIGTTHIKAMAATDSGVLAQASTHTPWETQAGRRVMYPQPLLEAVMSAISQGLNGLNDASPRVQAVAVTSMGEAGLYVTPQGPIGAIGAWQDVHGTEQGYRSLLEMWDAQSLFEITGLSPSPKFGLFRMRAQAPGKKDSAVRWLSVADFIIWHLTAGIAVSHESLAVRTLAYDWRHRQWNRDLLAWAGLDAEQMPHVLRAPTSVGVVSQTDEPRLLGAQVIHGGHDHVCAAYGADLQFEELMDSTGTAEPLLVRENSPVLSQKARRHAMTWAKSLFADDSYIGLLPTPAGGAPEVWAREVLGLSWSEVKNVFPHRATPVRFDPQEWAAGNARWQGLGYDVSRLDLYWAVLEGVSRSLADRVRDMEDLMDRQYFSLKVVGGIVKHGSWLAIRATHLKVPQWLMQPSSAALVGAIRCAANAVGAPMPVKIQWSSLPSAAP